MNYEPINLKVRYFLRSKGVITPRIGLRLAVGRGLEKRVSTGIGCPKSEWQNAAPTRPELKAKLYRLETTLHEIALALRMKGKQVTANTVWQAYQHGMYEALSISELFAAHIEYKHNEVKAGQISVKTVERTQRAHGHFLDFLAANRLENLPCEDVKAHHFESATLYFLSEKGFASAYAYKVLQCVKASFRYGLRHEKTHNVAILEAPLPRYTHEKTPHLTSSELVQIESAFFPSLPLQRAKDAFLFLCYTGISFSDYLTFNRERDVQKIRTSQGLTVEVIVKQRQKTGNEFYVPLGMKAKAILEKWKGLPYHCTLQTLNKELKNLASELGISKALTTRVARKTALNMLKKQGASIQFVQAVAGHSSAKTTEKHYLEKDAAQIAEQYNYFSWA